MAEGGLKGSRSAEGLDKPANPGKISSELLNKFESDPSLTGPQPLSVGHARLSAQSFTSSSEEIAASQEHIKSTSKTIRIKVPDQNEEHLSPSSADEDIVSDDEAGKGKKKKRKSKWKWSPFKKMRKLFRRKKSPTRVKSCEELPTARYKPTYLVSDQEGDDSLRNRTKSEPSLAETKTKSPLAAIEVYERRNTADNSVQRTKSEPSRQSLGKLLKNVRAYGKSQDSISEEPAMSSDERESQAGSVSAGLDWSMISSDSGTEAAVSFENLPSASSLEGLQAAHDRIKIAPKHRRPPTRAHPNSSSMNVKRNPLKPHRRSKTDPQDLATKTNVGTESNEGLAGSRSSDIVNTTIFEASEISDEKSKEQVIADMKAKASEVLAKVCESPKVNEKRIENGADTSDEVGENEGHIQTEREKSQESAEEQIKELHENKNNVAVNKENEDVHSTKPNVQIENKEESKAKETILKELNVKKDESRPLLDVSRRSISLNNFGIKDKSLESTIKPPLQRGFSLDSSEQNNDKSEVKTADVKLSESAQKEQPNKTESVHENKRSDVQNTVEKMSPTDVTKLESKAPMPSSLVKNLDADRTFTGVKLREKAHEKDDTSEQPAWIKLANRKSERYSQLLDNKDNQASLNVDSDLSSTPTTTTDIKGDQSKPHVKEKPKIPTKPQGLTNRKTPLDAPHQPKNKTTNIKVDKRVPFGKSLSVEETKETTKDKAPSHTSPADKCVVCGRTVYQMEKCNFDSSVLHRQCVKCSVCKRLLTVGNFVIAESKVYCKPHGKAVTVSL
ncbi:uncharacterized protein LOC144653062 [Oculina patagonica]